MGLLYQFRRNRILQRGDKALRHGQWESARAAFAEALEMIRAAEDPDGEYRVLVNLALMEFNLERWDPAAESLRAAFELATSTRDSERQANASVLLGNTLSRAGRADEATAAYLRGRRVAPGELGVTYNYAVHLRDSGRRAEALEETLGMLRELCREPDRHVDSVPPPMVIQLLLALSPGDGPEFERQVQALFEADLLAEVEAWNLCAIHHARHGRRDEARDLYRRALEVDPEFHEIYFNMGITQLEDDAEAALQAFEAFAKVEAGHPLSHYGNGMALRALGRDDAAREHLAAFLQTPLVHPTEIGHFDFDVDRIRGIEDYIDEQ